MRVQYVGAKKEIIEVTGLLGMEPNKLAKRLIVCHTPVISVNNSGRCASLDGNRRALFVVLKDSEVRVGSMGTEFLLGIRIDEPTTKKETTLVCKRGCLSELDEPEIRYQGVYDFVQRVHKQGFLPEHHEVPKALPDAMKRKVRF